MSELLKITPQQASSETPNQNEVIQNVVLNLEQKETLQETITDRVKSSLRNVVEKISTLMTLPEVKKLFQNGNYTELINNYRGYTPEVKAKVLSELIPILNTTTNLELIKLTLYNINYFKSENLDIKNIYTNLIQLDPKVIIDNFDIFKSVINPKELGKLTIKEGLIVPYRMIIFFDELESNQQNILLNYLILSTSNEGIDGVKNAWNPYSVDTKNEGLLNTLYERAIQARKPFVLVNNMDLFLTIKTEDEIKNDLKRLGWVENQRTANILENIIEQKPLSQEEEGILVSYYLATNDFYKLFNLFDRNKLQFTDRNNVIEKILNSNTNENLDFNFVKRILLSGEISSIKKNIDTLISRGEVTYILLEDNLKILLQRSIINLEEFGMKVLDKGGYGFIEENISLFPENVKKRYEEEKNKNLFTPENITRDIQLSKDKAANSTDEKEKQKYEQIINGLEYLLNYEQKVREELTEELGPDIVEHFLKRLNECIASEAVKICQVAMKEGITPIQALGLFQSKINKLVNERIVAFKAMDAGDVITVLGDRFKSQHELFGKRSTNASVRTYKDEFRLFGRNFNQTPVEYAPIYGYPSTMENGLTSRSKDIMNGNGVISYGGLTVRFNKERVARRTTMNFEDSLGSHRLFTFLSHPHFASFTNGMNIEMVTAGYREVDDPDFSRNTNQYNRAGTGYSELHYHNGLFPQDIEEIVIDDRLEKSSGNGVPATSKEEIEAIRNAVEKHNSSNPNNQIRIRICRMDKNGGVIWIE
jgi:hypothetical protein